MLRRTFLMLAAALALTVAMGGSPAMAQSLDALRSSGAVGERFDGLVVARDGESLSAGIQSSAPIRLNLWVGSFEPGDSSTYGYRYVSQLARENAEQLIQNVRASIEEAEARQRVMATALGFGIAGVISCFTGGAAGA